jgi:hypothetical protein
MILIVGAHAAKSLGIMPHQNRADVLSHGRLPRIILTHTARCSSLNYGHSIGVHPVDSLP